MPNTIWDFHHSVWWPHHATAQDRHLWQRPTATSKFFTMPFVDVPMTEVNWDPKHHGRLDRFMRAINYHKIWRYWHAWDKAGRYGDRDAASVHAHFRRGLAYAIYPALSCIQSGTGNLEQHRAWYRQYVPAIEELSTAGWEPVPYARVGNDVVVERFGSYADGELHFTLRNYAEQPVETVLTPDWQTLGVPASRSPGSAGHRSLERHDCRPLARTGLSVKLDADGARAFWIGYPACKRPNTVSGSQQRLWRSCSGYSPRRWTPRARQLGTPPCRSPGLAPKPTARRRSPKRRNLQQAASHLAQVLKTRSPVDLQKIAVSLAGRGLAGPGGPLGPGTAVTTCGDGCTPWPDGRCRRQARHRQSKA